MSFHSLSHVLEFHTKYFQDYCCKGDANFEAFSFENPEPFQFYRCLSGFPFKGIRREIGCSMQLPPTEDTWTFTTCGDQKLLDLETSTSLGTCGMDRYMLRCLLQLPLQPPVKLLHGGREGFFWGCVCERSLVGKASVALHYDREGELLHSWCTRSSVKASRRAEDALCNTALAADPPCCGCCCSARALRLQSECTAAGTVRGCSAL